MKNSQFYKTIMEKELLITKYKHGDNMKKKSIFSALLPRNRRSFIMYKTMKNYIVNKCGLEFQFCAGDSSDDTAAMTGRYSRAVIKMNELALECKCAHCFLHQEV